MLLQFTYGFEHLTYSHHNINSLTIELVLNTVGEIDSFQNKDSNYWLEDVLEIAIIYVVSVISVFHDAGAGAQSILVYRGYRGAKQGGGGVGGVSTPPPPLNFGWGG